MWLPGGSPLCYYNSDVHLLSLCSMCHYFFLSLHLLHFFSLPLASILCPGFAQLVPVAHHSALPVSYCYSALPCPIHVSHLPLPLVSIVVARAVCSHSLSRFACYFFLCLCLCCCVAPPLCCTPSVGWLRWLFSFLSVHRGRLLLCFIFGPSLRCIASVVCLGSLSATSRAVPSVLCLCHPPVTSIIVRPPHHLCLCGSSFVYCPRRRCVCRAI